ncbi:unnamed protein product [Spodoptera exigua]|nr:unnamed protein product [Spodoptera exigua]
MAVETLIVLRSGSDVKRGDINIFSLWEEVSWDSAANTCTPWTSKEPEELQVHCQTLRSVGDPCFGTNGSARLERYHGLTENRRETTTTLCFAVVKTPSVEEPCFGLTGGVVVTPGDTWRYRTDVKQTFNGIWFTGFFDNREKSSNDLAQPQPQQFILTKNSSDPSPAPGCGRGSLLRLARNPCCASTAALGRGRWNVTEHHLLGGRINVSRPRLGPEEGTGSANEQTDYLMISNQRRPWTHATTKELLVRCRPFGD